MANLIKTFYIFSACPYLIFQLLFFISFQIVKGQEKPTLTDWGVQIGNSTQQIYLLKDKDYKLIQHHVIGHISLNQFQLEDFKLDILSELVYYFSKHQLLNKWFTTTTYFDDFPEDFQQKMLAKKTIHQLAAHLGITFNWHFNARVAVFVYGSIDTMWTSQQTERLTAGLVFSDNIGFGLKLKYNEHFWISSTLVLRHESNADLKFPNTGNNTFGVRLGLLFN